jgi:pyruvate/2-oxoglutarate dehydrogenase complex dihydrolipoamide dehydrogenase (E3) component
MLLTSNSHHQVLLAHVRPPHWVNPAPRARYHLVVIGGGTAGLVTAAGAAGLGARVALIERHMLGGDCLNTGCVPSKALLSAARGGEGFARAFARVREARAAIAPHDSADRFQGLGVDVFFGDARFLDREHVGVDDQRLHFARAVIATGSRPAIPPIPGLAAASPLTSETVFDLQDPPRRLAIIGGGPVGCELAQAFAHLGVKVILFQDQPRLLERDDADAAAMIEVGLQREGVRTVTGARILSVETFGETRSIRYESASGSSGIDVSAILVCAGRLPNTGSLDLDAAAVAVAENGAVRVDDFLRTTNPRIFACGDVCLPWKFTHAADAAARIVIQNALFATGPFGWRRLSALTMGWCTFTNPEVAQVGLTEDDARTKGVAVDTFKQRLADLDRAVTDNRPDGFVKIHVRKGTPHVVGATIVGPRAGDIIGELAVAMTAKVTLARLASVIHPYPTYADAIRLCGDAYNRTRLTPAVKTLLRWWLRRIR